MKRIVIVIIFCIASTVCAQLDGDKALHFGAGAISGYFGGKIADKISDGNPFWIITGAFTSSMLVGVAKEAYDEHRYKGWNNEDLAATVLGGVSIGITINLFSGKQKRNKNIKLTTFSPREGFHFDNMTFSTVHN
jgi:uncharacterized protein YfiM (DUF2279 family)